MVQMWLLALSILIALKSLEGNLIAYAIFACDFTSQASCKVARSNDEDLQRDFK